MQTDSSPQALLLTPHPRAEKIFQSYQVSETVNGFIRAIHKHFLGVTGIWAELCHPSGRLPPRSSLAKKKKKKNTHGAMWYTHNFRCPLLSQLVVS